MSDEPKSAKRGKKQINKDNQAAIKSAYQDLEKLGAGKIEVDSRSFGNGALKALSEGEDTDFLPSIIKTKIICLHSAECNFTSCNGAIKNLM